MYKNCKWQLKLFILTSENVIVLLTLLNKA